MTVVETEGMKLLPGVEDFRTQIVEQARGDMNWPFTIKRGILMCAKILGEPAVYFSDAGNENSDVTRVAQVSVNPFDLGIGNLGDGGLVRREMTMEERIKAMAPLLSVGRRLCQQPKGTNVGPGEL